MKRILFIAWDAPHVSYLEGLFVPIFEGLMKTGGYEFHIIQFSWATEERVSFLQMFCGEKGIPYSYVPVLTRPIAPLGKYLTTLRGVRVLSRYILDNNIDIAMPRSTMPASMLLKVKSRIPSLKIIFDADGLPIEERVDFAALREGSLRHRQLKSIEKKMIRTADCVLTRTQRAAVFLADQYKVSVDKFYTVTNGRNATVFYPRPEQERLKLRKSLGIADTALALIYSGSLGPQYGVEQMLYLHRELQKIGRDVHLVVLTNNEEYFRQRMNAEDRNIVVRKLSFGEVPGFLAVGDIALAIRRKTRSMQGVAPVKVAEYLLSGLPVIASSGIGDTDVLLDAKQFAFLLGDYSTAALDDAVKWVAGFSRSQSLRQEARNFALEEFSLEKSVSLYHKAISAISE